MTDIKQKRSYQNRVQGYLTKGNKTFIETYIKENSLSESQAVNEAIRLLKASIAPFPVKK